MPWAVVGAVGGALISANASSEASGAAEEASQRSIDANKWQGELATEQYNQYKENYLPLEKSFVQEAQNYDSQQNLDRAAGEARATVGSEFGRARERLSRGGMDPTSAGYQANMAGLELAQAATEATSQNAARNGIKDKAWARRMDALGLGKGLVANASTGMANAGNSALGLANAQYGRAQSQASGAGQMFGSLMQSGQTAYKNWNAEGGAGSGGGGGGLDDF